MFSLVLVYFVAKSFYELAEKHGKSDWGFAIVGVVSYYAGIFLGGMIIALIQEAISPGTLGSEDSMWVNILAVPLGILSCYGAYVMLKRSWSKPREIGRQTLDSDLIVPESERYNKDEHS